MTFTDLQNLMLANRENFSDGKKPTFEHWQMFARAYSAALTTPLDTDYANSCLNAAGIKKDAIISAEVLSELFINLYLQSYHVDTIHDFLRNNGFTNGDKPNGMQFQTLNSLAFLHASQNQIRVSININCLSGYNANSSAGIDFKTYEDSYVMCKPSQQGNYLSNKIGSTVSTAYIDVSNTIPIILSPYIGIQLFGCTFTNANMNMTLYDDNIGTAIGSMPTVRQSSTFVYISRSDILMLSQSISNKLTILITS